MVSFKASVGTFTVSMVFIMAHVSVGERVSNKSIPTNKTFQGSVLKRLAGLKKYLRKRMDQINYCQLEHNPNMTSRNLPRQCKRSQKQYKIQYKDVEPYSGIEARKFINSTIHNCCRNRSQIIITEKKAEAQMIYPVLGDSNSEMAYGYYFIPLLSPPGAFYITRKDKLTLSVLISKCLDLWPILVVCLFLSAIAGFVAWLLETWKNNAEFPRPFLRGWSEGIWWSFVTITTVGYGDIAPKSTAARLFSIMWILAGIIVFSILAGELTTIILQANTKQIHVMAGEKVGILSERIYDKSLVVRNGGLPVSGYGREIEQIEWLKSQLYSENVSGILLDKNTYWKVKADMQRNYSKELWSHFFLKDTVTTDIPHSGDAVSYGILMKDKMHQLYLGSTMKSRRLVLQNTLTSHLAPTESQSEPHMFQTMFDENYKYLCIVLVVVLCLGFVLEAYRKRRGIKRMRSSLLRKSQTNGTSLTPNKSPRNSVCPMTYLRETEE